MKTLSLESKLLAYRYARFCCRYHNKEVGVRIGAGICHWLYKYLANRCIVAYALKAFPEFYQFKKHHNEEEFWFTTHEERMSAINKCIDETIIQIRVREQWPKYKQAVDLILFAFKSQDESCTIINPEAELGVKQPLRLYAEKLCMLLNEDEKNWYEVLHAINLITQGH